MATLTWNGPYDFSLKYFNLSYIGNAWDYSRSSTSFTAYYDTDSWDEFTGSGFTYNADGIPTGGVVKSYSGYVDGEKIGSITGARIPVIWLVAAAATYSTSDDVRVYKSALSGNDRIRGGDYDDRLEGFSGHDRLEGGLGADRLFGGSGSDIFIFRSVDESNVEAFDRDTIYDFSAKQKDRIDLRAIDANTALDGNQSFSFIGKNGFHNKAGELRYEKVSGGMVVYGDVDGDATPDFAISVKGVSSISKGYFYL